MTALPPDVPTDAAAARHERLARGVAGVRRRSGTIDVQRTLLIAGSVLLPTGLIVILLGWFGASHTSYDFEQVPYLISGGILGVGITIAGGFLYFGYWLTRIVQESQRQRSELVALLTRLDNRMAVFEAVASGSLPAKAPASSTNGAGATGLVATATGTMVHRTDCALVQGKTGLRPVTGEGPGLKACKVCQPFAGDEEARLPASGRG